MKGKIKKLIQRGLRTTGSFERTYRNRYSKKEFKTLINYIHKKIENGKFAFEEFKGVQGEKRIKIKIEKGDGDSEIQLYTYHNGEEYSHLRLSRILEKGGIKK